MHPGLPGLLGGAVSGVSALHCFVEEVGMRVGYNRGVAQASHPAVCRRGGCIGAVHTAKRGGALAVPFRRGVGGLKV